MNKPIAFLLVKFQGSPAEPITVADAQTMFTTTGSGKLNVTDWFHDNSHGAIDMSKNQVFGWLELSESQAGYNARRTAGTYARTAIIDLARAAAVTAGHDLSSFDAVVVVTNVGVDLFGGSGFACCTAERGSHFWENHCAPSVLCQEMIHALGVYEHTRRDGSDADYQDPYDVMSMYIAYPGHHPSDTNLPIGPGTNAAFMQRCGWLDTKRAAIGYGQIQLRPLHRRDLPGPLFARVGQYYVEYRKSERWDAGFPSIVLIHYLANNTSYLIAELRQGDPPFRFGIEANPLQLFGSGGSVHVDRIDDANSVAFISTSSTQRELPEAGPAFSLFQTEFGDGSGIVFVNGKWVRIPPRSPEFELVNAASTLATIEQSELTPGLKTRVRAEVYAGLVERFGIALEEITEVSSVLDHVTMEEAVTFQKTHGARARKA